MGMETEVEHITDISKMLEMGVMQSPVLAINNKPVLTGGGHSEKEIKDALINSSNSGGNAGACACGGCC